MHQSARVVLVGTRSNPVTFSVSATAYAVVVTIDDHETVVSFESKEAAESFAEVERARLTDAEQKANGAPQT